MATSSAETRSAPDLPAPSRATAAASNAALVGAKTVNVPGRLNVSTSPALARADTKVLKLALPVMPAMVGAVTVPDPPDGVRPAEWASSTGPWARWSRHSNDRERQDCH